jgi:hypothetical protein
MTDVKGYTPLSDEQKALANEGKELEERYLRWLDELATDNEVDPRALALAKTHIQTGAMWAIRSIFKPSRVSIPEDEA